MQNKITKAPWYIARGNNGYHVQSAKINQDNYVCFVDREADAHLIASAPELLKACKDILKNDGGAYDLQPYQSRMLINAINKAKGVK